jgi:hypothetical protein
MRDYIDTASWKAVSMQRQFAAIGDPQFFIPSLSGLAFQDNLKTHSRGEVL